MKYVIGALFNLYFIVSFYQQFSLLLFSKAVSSQLSLGRHWAGQDKGFNDLPFPLVTKMLLYDIKICSTVFWSPSSNYYNYIFFQKPWASERSVFERPAAYLCPWTSCSQCQVRQQSAHLLTKWIWEHWPRAGEETLWHTVINRADSDAGQRAT